MKKMYDKYSHLEILKFTEAFYGDNYATNSTLNKSYHLSRRMEEFLNNLDRLGYEIKPKEPWETDE